MTKVICNHVGDRDVCLYCNHAGYHEQHPECSSVCYNPQNGEVVDAECEEKP